MTPTDPTTDTIHTYDAHAEAYARVNAADVMRGQLEAFLARLEPDSAPRVLDAGSGHGRDAAYLAGRGCRVTALDRSAGLLTVSRQIAPEAALCQGDLRRLPFAARAFDGVWSCAALLHLPRAAMPTALGELARVLKPGGALFLSLKAGTGERWIPAPAYGGEPRWFTFYTVDELKGLVRESGCAVAAVESDGGWINLFAHRTARRQGTA